MSSINYKPSLVKEQNLDKANWSVEGIANSLTPCQTIAFIAVSLKVIVFK